MKSEISDGKSQRKYNKETGLINDFTHLIKWKKMYTISAIPVSISTGMGFGSSRIWLLSVTGEFDSETRQTSGEVETPPAHDL